MCVCVCGYFYSCIALCCSKRYKPVSLCLVFNRLWGGHAEEIINQELVFVCLCEAVFVYKKFVYVKERQRGSKTGKDANKCSSLFWFLSFLCPWLQIKPKPDNPLIWKLTPSAYGQVIVKTEQRCTHIMKHEYVDFIGGIIAHTKPLGWCYTAGNHNKQLSETNIHLRFFHFKHFFFVTFYLGLNSFNTLKLHESIIL